MSQPSTVTAMKTETTEERAVLRKLTANNPAWKECSCGWFYTEPRCPDQTCKVKRGKKLVKLFAHSDEDSYYGVGESLGMTGDALRSFAHWGYELAFDCEVDLDTGAVKLLTVNGLEIK